MFSSTANGVVVARGREVESTDVDGKILLFQLCEQDDCAEPRTSPLVPK
jgi:hypothetical protein